MFRPLLVLCSLLIHLSRVKQPTCAAIPEYGVAAASSTTFHAPFDLLPGPIPPLSDNAVSCNDRESFSHIEPIDASKCHRAFHLIFTDPMAREIQTFGPNFKSRVWQVPGTVCEILLRTLKESAVERLSLLDVAEAARDILGFCATNGYGGVKLVGRQKKFYTAIFAISVDARTEEDTESIPGKEAVEFLTVSSLANIPTD